MQRMNVECPFCEIGIVETMFTPSIRREKKESFGRGHTKSVITYSKERYDVVGNCPHCGEKARKIQRKLNNPSEMTSRKNMLKRLKKAGLPTRI